MLSDNLVDTIATGLTTAMSAGGNYADHLVSAVYKRDMMPTDPPACLYVLDMTGMAYGESEIGQAAPATWRWPIEVRIRVRSADEVEGRRERGILIWRVIREVYRTSGLGGSLRALSESGDGVVEHVLGLPARPMVAKYHTKEPVGWVFTAAVTLPFDCELEMA